MRPRIAVAVAAGVLFVGIAVRLTAQGAPPAPPAPAGAAGQGAAAQGGRGRAGGGAPATFPAQQRQLADAAVITRGKALYEINCRACHGADLRGGDAGGPNLLRSQVALNDQHGELIYPIVRDGKQTPGQTAMPALGLPEADVVAIAEYVHSIQFTARGQGSPPAGPPVVLNLLVGDANAGKAYFATKCSACHSATGDMATIGTRIPDVMTLQNTWVGGAGGRGGRGGQPTPVTVTITPASGPKVEGRLVRVDDFIVIVALADGSTKSFRRDGDVPKVDIKDPRDAHRNLLPTYTDKDIHDVTAYLVTLK
ncbi:MAG: c-type cytochrome [Acidobacteriota bacterium]